MPTIRDSLAGLDPSACDHPYLAFERLIPDNQVEGDGKRKHQVNALQHDIRENLRAAYVPAFERRYRALEGFTGGVEGAVTQFYSLPVQGRLAAGLGNASVLENGLSLNHTYGLPYLPGTGLKGMASSMAHLGLDTETWQRGKEVQGTWTRQGTDHKVLFGTMDTGAEDAAAGIVIFHDAWWDPAPNKVPEKRLPFEPDVMTPHHQKYNLDGAEWPNDWESPIPVPFLTVSGTFRVALTGPAEWVEAAFEILRMAFLHLGFGAKTQIGYGRGDLARFETEDEVAQRLKLEAETRLADQEREAEASAHKAADLRRQREESQRTAEGKLIRTDPGRGIFTLAFDGHVMAGLTRLAFPGVQDEAWELIDADAKKRGDRGGRVKVRYCMEEGKAVLLGLEFNPPPP